MIFPRHPKEAYCTLCGSPLSWDEEYPRVGLCTFVDCRHRWRFTITSRNLLPSENNQWIVTGLGVKILDNDRFIPFANALDFLREQGFRNPENLLLDRDQLLEDDIQSD